MEWSRDANMPLTIDEHALSDLGTDFVADVPDFEAAADMIQDEINKIDDEEVKNLLGGYFANMAVKQEANRLAKRALALKKKQDNRRKNKVARKARRRNRK